MSEGYEIIEYPSCLERPIQKYQEKQLTEIEICANNGNDLLEVWYYGELFLDKSENRLYITHAAEAPAKIVAKEVQTQEEILIFDGAAHSYYAMFCDSYTTEQKQNRPLQKYAIPASRLIVELGYSIDYEEEKKDYDFDEQGRTILLDGQKLDWEQVKAQGYDYLALSFVSKQGKKIQIADFELA